MSCYHPITIQNPKLVKNNVYDRTLIEVPCGHCPSCKEVKRLGWFVRLYFEWLYCVSLGGFALFETLTYNKEHLPHLIINNDSYPCFSTRHIQLYLKKIRKYLSKYYPDVSFKYFLSMEYGGTTHRPHYHIVFFVSSSRINCNKFKKLVEDYWSCDLHYTKKGRPDYTKGNGFVKQGKLNNGFVCSQGGLNYCAKYVCKDIYEETYFRKIGLKFQMIGVSKEQLRDFFPHNMQSQNLGVYALEMDMYNDLDTFFNGKINIPDNVMGVKSYKLPLYYERKIFYDVKYRYFDEVNGCYYSVDTIDCVPFGCDYSPIYVLNDLGIEMKDKRFQKSFDAVLNVYRSVMALPISCNCFIDKLNKKYDTKFKDLQDFQKHIKCNLSEEDFVKYSLVYRGCSLSEYCRPSVCPPDNVYVDYMLVHNMSRGIRPLSVDFNNLCNNIDDFSLKPYIEDNYQYIRFLYYLLHLEFERIYLKKEFDYVMQKSVYLAQEEHIV